MDTGRVELRIDGAVDDVGVVELPPVLERRDAFVGRNSYTAQSEQCSVYFQGLNGEVLLYVRSVDESERARIEAYLVDKWQAPAASGGS